VASSHPPIVLFQNSNRPGQKPGQKKDTLANVEATGEFVVNIVSEDLATAMNLSSGDYPPEVDEFEKACVTPIASDVVRPPRVAESPVQFECKMLQIIPVSETPSGGTLVLGQVVRFHVADDLIEDYKIDPAKLRAIGRMGGAAYCRTSDRFNLERPTAE
jgi:flavin reductase (DIM6/NTAB) family NADH-FMN oxidoreductase RutF